MKTLLVVDVSPRLEFSVSRNLTSRFVEGAFTPRKQHSSANRSPLKRAEFGSPSLGIGVVSLVILVILNHFVPIAV
jgi:hypothetical protein